MEAIRTETIRRNEETGLPTTGNKYADLALCVGTVAVIATVARKLRILKF